MAGTQTVEQTLSYACVVSILPLWSHEEMLEAQEKDPDIGPVLKLKTETGNL